MNFFSEQPPILRAAIALVTCGSLAAIAVFDYRIVEIIAVCAVFLAALLAGYHYLLRWRESRKSRALRGEIQQHSAAAPNAINDPARRARLDDLKRNFETGLDKFRTSGKDVYKLPWYLIVGEPGSGKTEAVRHCNVGFPPGLQDELQGVGGTINMNWWFTNQAVLLDTAGRLMFEEIKPGESSEWREFLNLLRRNRPNCPINGLLLVIPADALIRDSAEVLYKKAGKIAQQLDLIQRSLDIRFPVFVLVTKCDLLNGFREFFEDFQDAQTQHQILGWSNPAPRDTIFNPALVDEYLEEIIHRIKKRRLGLLRDPIPQANGGRRIDEVDSLFGLPQSFALVSPRLRTYLEKIFVAGEWSAKPLFLRGIYFTSAMREGQALDQELAQVLGLSVDDLPEGRAWERERAYFLRDVFTEKIFREKGLVTRASDTRVLLRRRQAILLGFCALAALVWLGLTFYGVSELRRTVGAQARVWLPGAEHWEAGMWNPIVKSRSDAGPDNLTYNYMGKTPIGDLTLDQYHQRVSLLSGEPIQLGFVFRPLARLSLSKQDRLEAQRILFEGGVVKPLLEAGRRRMRDRPVTPPEGTDVPASALMRQEAVGLAALIRLEAASAATGSGKSASALPNDFLLPLLEYDTTESWDAKRAGAFPSVLQVTYSNEKGGTWPPKWSSAGKSLKENRPIDIGLQRLIGGARKSLQGQEERVEVLQKLRRDLLQFRAKEIELNSNSTLPDDATIQAPQTETNAVGEKTEQAFNELAKIKQALDADLQRARELNANGVEWSGIQEAYQTLIKHSETDSKEAFDLVLNATEDFTHRPEAGLTGRSYPLFSEVAEKVKQVRKDLKEKIEAGFTKEEIAELPKLDALLADFGNGSRVYSVRWSIYETAHRQLGKGDPPVEIGAAQLSLENIKDEVDGTRKNLGRLEDKFKDKDSFSAAEYFLRQAETKRTDAILSDYRKQTYQVFDSRFHGPLVSGDGKMMSLEQVQQAADLVKKWRKDLNSDAFKAAQSDHRKPLARFLQDLDEISGRLQSLAGNVTISLLSYDEAPDKSGLMRYRRVRVGGREPDTSLPGGPLLTCPILGTFHAVFIDYSTGSASSTSYDRSVLDLLGERQGSGRVKIRVGGLPIWLVISGEGAGPLGKAPPKAPILGRLNT